MRIACILTVFPSVAETFIFADARALKKSGHEVILMHFLNGTRHIWQEDALHLRQDVIRGGPLLSVSVIRDLGVFLFRRPIALMKTVFWILGSASRNFTGFWKTAVILPKCVQFAADCRRGKVEHVHATWANHAAIAALVIRRLTGIPFSMSAHAGQDVFRDPVMLRDKVAAAEFVVACNRAAHRRLLEIVGRKEAGKIHHLSHGVDLDRFSISARKGRRQPEGEDQPPRIVFVGRLQYGKGIPFLIQAADLLRSRNHPFHLDIFGDGPEFKKIQDDLKSRDLEGWVTLFGAVDQETVARNLAGAALLAVPSEVRHDGGKEGLPNVVLEAMACGVPVVASRISAMEEAVQDGVNGLLVPQRDPKALADAMARILDQPELADRLGTAGRKAVEQRFNRKVCSEKFASFFG